MSARTFLMPTDFASPEFTPPPGFVWGVATSAYQIEGAVSDEGRGPSVWDVFCRQPGKVRHGDSGDVACDHYRRYQQDAELLAELGVPAYRFSTSWPRVFPLGTGAVNERGLDFYDRLVDALAARAIEPWITLFHWDYPQRLQERGGWLNPSSPRWFADYVGAVVDRLSDRVRRWITINEPQCFLRFGHGDGCNAPGLTLSLPERLQAGHHALLAHGRAVEVIRAQARQPSLVGWAPVGVTAIPESLSAGDLAAADVAMRDVPENLWSNVWFSDPVFHGAYPADGVERFGRAMPRFTAAEMACIAAPIDFLGLNIYTGAVVRQCDTHGYAEVPPMPGAPRTAFDWPVREEALYWGPKFHAERYGKPIYITENGMANVDWVDRAGEVNDPQRIDYLARHIEQVGRAIAAGVDVRGYFVWSFLDNFEWAEGYGKRFGLVYVDYATQRRIPKASAHWYRQLIRR